MNVDNGLKKTYVAIDLKSFYASVECVERGLDPLTTNLLVADVSKTEKTICLAVTPSLKAYGISGRARLFEAVQQVKLVNIQRKNNLHGKDFIGSSFDDRELKNNPNLAVDFIAAPPRMAHYMEYSTRVYKVYLKHVSPEDIHVYSIDEVFIDATSYLKTRGMTGHEFARMLIKDVLRTTGITATAGVGTNMYLCKIAMDIVAKHAPADEDGVRIAELDEMSYRRLLWEHRPLIDFWRVGRGYARTLEANGLYTMGDIARCSIGDVNAYYNEDLLYKLFGVNAELLIDHAWGYEPCTIAEIKAYKPASSSICSGQVLHTPYDFEKARLIVREMTDLLSLDLAEKGLVTDQLVLTVGYDIENLTDATISAGYKGPITTDHYGRRVPKHAHGTKNLERYTASSRLLTSAAVELYEDIVDKRLLVRRLNITANRVIDEKTAGERPIAAEQLDIFTDYEEIERKRAEELAALEKEKLLQSAIIGIKRKHGKNAILKGINLEEGATAKDRNSQIGGHKA